MKTIVFDFDNTLTTYDTIYPFLLHANQDMLYVRGIKRTFYFLFRILFRLKVISNYQLKNLGVKLFIRGYTEGSIELSAKEFFEKLTFHEKAYREFENSLKEENAKVYLSTASFIEYVNELKKQHSGLIIQASELNYQDGKVKGLKCNNYGYVKTNFWEEESIDIFYTDSLSDLPLAQKANQVVHISQQGDLKVCHSLDHFIQLCRDG